MSTIFIGSTFIHCCYNFMGSHNASKQMKVTWVALLVGARYKQGANCMIWTNLNWSSLADSKQLHRMLCRKRLRCS